ncbi:glucoside xylosyltransferase 1-like isoform X1 [Syngnathus acus]|uniref:glucoside xylosyltransferase 1-like isoform X1 n=1 Tax=Syngnathus acus TaxID=161584 RepID=UPI00188646CF|nr:glucoside xylosyltransferase 1-like isoform X1 [Syngnathus acus]
MRRYRRALLLCSAFTFFSSLYVFNHLASSLEDTDGRRLSELKTPDGGSPDSGNVLGKRPGSAGRRVRLPFRCKSLSVSYWNPFWRLPADVCGLNRFMESSFRDGTNSEEEDGGDESSHLAVVACGPRLDETLTMLKSALLFSKKPLKFHIFADEELQGRFQNSLHSWPRSIQSKFNFTIYPITFPSGNENEWKKLFKPCASQRLFLPLILKEVDSLLYVDTDILFLHPVEGIWAAFSRFNSSQLAAMAPEHEEPRIGWYNRFARHPYYGNTGVNSGVMLMNMTRLRKGFFKNGMTTVALQWSEMLMPLLQKYKLNITWGDQDLLNIIFHHNPENLYVFPCPWNYRPDHCVYGLNCQQAEEDGVFILHGSRGVYHNEKQPAFRAVYEAIKQYPFGENMETSLLQPLEAALRTAADTYCGRVSHLFTKSLKQSIASVRREP